MTWQFLINCDSSAFSLGLSPTSSCNSNYPVFINLHPVTWFLLLIHSVCPTYSTFYCYLHFSSSQSSLYTWKSHLVLSCLAIRHPALYIQLLWGPIILFETSKVTVRTGHIHCRRLTNNHEQQILERLKDHNLISTSGIHKINSQLPSPESGLKS